MAKKLVIDRKTIDIANDAWLDLGDTSLLDVKNPMADLGEFWLDNIDLLIYKIMRDPQYLWFTCKYLFNVELHPMQVVVIQEIWRHPFPMLIGSRGFSKSFLMALYAMIIAVLVPGSKIIVVGAAFRQAKMIFEYAEQIYLNAPVLRSICDKNSGPRRDIDRCKLQINDSWVVAIPLGDGCLSPFTVMTYDDGFRFISDKKTGEVWGNTKFRTATEFYDNGVKPVTRVTTKRGYSYEGTDNHAMKVCRNGQVDWCRTDELKVGDRILIDRSMRWHNGKFNAEMDEAYLLGAMIGNGMWTQEYSLRFTSSDAEHFLPILNKIFEKPFNEGDEYHYDMYSKRLRQEWLGFWELDVAYSHQKVLPRTILSARRELMTECLRGLFDTDGSLQLSTAKGGMAVTVTYCTTSKILAKQIHYILLHYGIISTLSHRTREEGEGRWNEVWELMICGKEVAKFQKRIGFSLPRKRDLLESGLSQKTDREMTFDDNIPDVLSLMLDISSRYRQKRNNASPNLCYSKLKRLKTATFNTVRDFLDKYAFTGEPGLKDISSLLDDSIYYDVVDTIDHIGDDQTFDIHVPEGNEYCANGFYSHNSKIRGMRAHIILADEFSSIRPDVYETVIAGFAVVSQSPIENIKSAAKREYLKGISQWDDELEQQFNERKGNQAILSGTASYDFEHFAQYWRRYKAIIESKGDMRRLQQTFGTEDELDESFNWKDYCVLRIPYKLVPKGFMDAKHVARARATVSNGVFLNEYAACFAKDSAGFFKRTLIESCVGTDIKPVTTIDGDVWFDCATRGNPRFQYVMSIDPASEVDNFCIIILELHPNHSRVVYCWTMTKSRFQKRVKAGVTTEHNFFSYCAKKIYELAESFPTVHIAIDSQGGGYSLVEALGDPNTVTQGRSVIYPIPDEKKPIYTDDLQGRHIVEFVQFASAEWVNHANHSLKKDMEDRALLFPRFDSAGIVLALDSTGVDILKQEHDGDLYDTLEDLMMEIEELKNELTTIVHTKSTLGQRDRWDTPDLKTAEGKKGKMKKDRYSALLMAAYAAHQIHRAPPTPEYGFSGGLSHTIDPKAHAGKPLYIGPSWFTEGANNSNFKSVMRKQ